MRSLRPARAVLLALVCAFVPAVASAQAYLIEETEAAYEPLGPTEGTTLANQADAELFEVTLPFTFRFFSRPYTKVWVSANGGVTFIGVDPATGQTLALPDANVPVPSAARPQAVLAAVWDDWKANVSAPEGGSRIAVGERTFTDPEVEDGPPQRTFVIDWQRMQRYGNEGPSAPAYSFQLLLHEGTDRYELRYGAPIGAVPAALDATGGSENHLGTVGVAHKTCNPTCGASAFFPSPTQLVSPNLDAELVLSISRTGAVANGGPVVDVQVQNLGLTEAPAVTFELFLSADAKLDAGDVRLYTHATPFDLAARPSEARFTVNVPVPADAKGPYYVIGRAEGVDPISEQNKDNNVAALAERFIAGVDLTVETFGQAAADLGGNSTYNVRIHNRGVRDAAGAIFKLSLTGGVLTAPLALLTSEPLAVPAEGSTLKNVVVTIPASLSPGAYRLDTIVDPDNAIEEADETNNRVDERLDVELRGADVLVRNISAGVPIGFQGQTMPVQFVLENKGTAYATNFLYAIYLSPDNDVITRQDVRVYLSESITLAPKEVRLLSRLVQLPETLTPGLYFPGVIVDAAGRLKELDISNNVAPAATPITIAPPTADIVAASVSTQPRAAAGATTRLSAVLANVGTLSATFEYGLYLSDNELASPSDAPVASGQLTLAPGEQQNVSFDAAVPPTLRPGDYHVALIADPTNAVADANRANNIVRSQQLLRVDEPALAILNKTLPDALVSTSYDVLLGASGGTAALRWSVAGGALPSGLTLDEDGRIHGVPTSAGVFAVVVEATSAELRALQALAISVREYAASLGILDTRLPAARRGILYEQRIGASGGTGNWTFSKTGGEMPPGLTLAADGLVSGFPVSAGSFPFTVTVRDEAGQQASAEVTLDVHAEGALTLLATRLREAEVSRPYSATLPIEGGQRPYEVSLAAGALPEGLTLALDPSGVAASISGTALRAGVYGFSLIVSDARGERTVEHLVLQVTARRLSFVTGQLPAARLGASYRVLIEANARAPFTFSLAGGALPPGLELDQSGLVTGTVPSDAAARLYAFAVRVTDEQGGDALAAFSIDLPAPVKQVVVDEGCSTTGGSTVAFLSVLAFLLIRRRTRAGAALLATVSTLVALPASAYYRVVREPAPYVPFGASPARTIVLDTTETNFDQTSTTTRGKAVPLPFPFKFYGVEQSVAGITSKGMLSFGSVSTTWSRDELTPLPGRGGPSQFLAPLWGYIQLSKETPTTPSEVSWRLEGQEPRRVMAMQWHNMQHAGWASPGPYKGADFAAYSFQVRLHEGTNEITYHYGGDAVLLGRTPPLGVAMGIEGVDGVQGIDASDTRCSPGCTAANFPIDTAIRFLVVPDLSVDALEAPQSLFEGVETTIRTVVRNAGDTDASRAQVRLVLSKDRFFDENDVLFADTPATTIVGAASASISARGAVPTGTTPGIYYLIARVDPANEIFELDESNNDFEPRQVVVLQRAADFVPVRLVGPNAVDIGQPFQVTRTIRNVGNAAGSGSFRLVLSANELASPADLVLEEGSFNLEPGATLDVSPSVTVPATVTPGSYHLGLIVRPAAGQSEIDPLDNDRVFGPLTVRGSALAITRDALPTVAAGVPFSIELAAAGGSGGYAWSVGHPAPPPGVTLSAGGLLAGRVETTGEWPVQVRVESSGALVSRTYTLRATGVVAPLSVVSRRLTTARLAESYEGHLLAQGGKPPYRWTLEGNSALPRGLLLAADGTVEGIPGADGEALFHARVTDATGATATGEVTLPIAGPTRPLFASADLPPARLGEAYDGIVRGAGGAAPYRFSVVDTRRVTSGSADEGGFYVGELPPGLVLAEDGRITGTPTLAGVFIMTLRLVDARASDATAQFALAIGGGEELSIRTRALPDAVLGQAFAGYLLADGGTGKVTWEAVLSEDSAGFPPGLSFLADGTLVGTPLAAGQVSFLAVARDEAGRYAVQPLALRVVTPPAPVTEEKGCSQTGGASLLAVAALLFFLLPRRRVLVLIAALAGAACTEAKTTPCPQGCSAPFVCDPADDLCKCGGPGGAVCTTGETCEPALRSCLAATCESGCAAPLVCGEGGLCRCGSPSGPVCAEGEECSPFGRCEVRSRCEGVVCAPGMTCDPASGTCTCGPGGDTCGERERCIDATCVTDPCLGVSCSGGNACDPTDGLCKCGGAGGAVCASGEACAPGEARCVRSSRCDGVTCGAGDACDPADGLCKCGGPGGPVCGEAQSCDPLARRCIGGDQCAGVTCTSGTSCDPEDGVCKCGGYGGVACTTNELCVVKGSQAKCEEKCDVLASSCSGGRACRWNVAARQGFCEATGTAGVGVSCGVESGPCGPNLHCVGETATRSGTCRAYCRVTPGCATGFLCFPFEADDATGTCLPYTP